MRHAILKEKCTARELLECADRVFCGGPKDRDRLKARERILLYGLLKYGATISPGQDLGYLQHLLRRSGILCELYMRGLSLSNIWDTTKAN
jgi:hypothetical protein